MPRRGSEEAARGRTWPRTLGEGVGGGPYIILNPLVANAPNDTFSTDHLEVQYACF